MQYQWSALPVNSTVAVILILLTTIIAIYNWKRARLYKLMSEIPGPPALPIIGNTIEINVDHDGKR